MLRLLFTVTLLGISSSDQSKECLSVQVPGCHCSNNDSADLSTLSIGKLTLNCSGTRQGSDILGGHQLTDLQYILPFDLKVSSVFLDHNNISSLDLGILKDYPNLINLKLRNNQIKTLINSLINANSEHSVRGRRISLQHLDLSYNNLQVIQITLLTGLGDLKMLNISNNHIHTIIQDRTIRLGQLKSLDLSYNSLTEMPDMVENIPHLQDLRMSHNRISRITELSFSGGGYVKLSWLDVSHNYIMALDDEVLAGMNLTLVNLGYNKLKKMPSAALRNTRVIGHLILDGNIFTKLETGAIHNVNVVRISLCHCDMLTQVEQSSLTSLPVTTSINISHNPKLAYIHPGSITSADKLVSLDLSHNVLTSLENMTPYLANVQMLWIGDNHLVCHCSLAWLQQLLTRSQPDSDRLNIQDKDKVSCEGGDIQKISLRNSKWCTPYILPLYSERDTVEMGHNVSWPCRSLNNIPKSGIETRMMWMLANGSEALLPGTCDQGDARACVDMLGDLRLSYVHPEDRGIYTCTASNTNGNFSRLVELEVKVLNIILFPVSIAASFVTLSWNTSQSLARDYILQVYTGVMKKNQCEDHPFLQYNNIEVNHKMNSYTISNLSPDTVYTVMLCLNKNSHKIPISMLKMTTRPQSYMVQLGIVKDYTAIITVVLVLGFAGFSCIALTVFRIYRFRCLIMTDSLDTKNIMVSPSEHESWSHHSYQDDYPSRLSPRSYTTWSNEKPKPYSDILITGYKDCDSREKSKLMDNEVASPVDDFNESSA